MQTATTLIAMRGYPGTGKSTIARAITMALQATLIDRDIIRQTAVDIFSNVPMIGRFSYELLFTLAREQLSLGLSVVLDTPLTYRITYDRARNLAESFQIPLLVVHCQCSPEVQKRRLEGRRGRVSPFQITSWEEWERWKPRFEAFEIQECIIDTSHPLQDSLLQVMQALNTVHAYNQQLLEGPEVSDQSCQSYQEQRQALE